MLDVQPPLDLRIRRTHKLLWEALLDLMTQQDIETISVKDICDRAMVHRTTFYKHYVDKYDLLAHGIQQMHALLLAEMEHTPKEASTYSRFFEFVTAHKRFYRVMLSANSVQRYQTQLQDYFAKLITVKGPKPGDISTIPLPLVAHFCAGAIVSTLTWWLKNDIPYSAQQMGEYLKNLLGDTA